MSIHESVSFSKEDDLESKKQKLTLSVDASVVEKAKSLGLNISGITENILRGFAFEPKEGGVEEVYSKYKSLFEVIAPILKKYDTWITVGEELFANEQGDVYGSIDYSLGPKGEIWPRPDGEIDPAQVAIEATDIHKIDAAYLLPPSKIVTNLIKAMADSAENNKQRVAELELARRIVEAIAGTQGPEQGKTKRPRRKKQVSVSG